MGTLDPRRAVPILLAIACAAAAFLAPASSAAPVQDVFEDESPAESLMQVPDDEAVA